ncbi:MAG: Glycosyltransferase involved in cell wall bisynthesis [Verrucomicrobia bacterium]|nr:MAG: Glycosyltransferase involved in cell wall bisynthesis [Verrucomicrobiota bacterium]
MKSLILTNEFPPNIYGGAGVHVDYLTRELSKLMEVEVRCFGAESRHSLLEGEMLKATAFGANAEHYGAPKKLHGIFSALQRCLDWATTGVDADIVHLHTWYTHLGGILAKLNYGIPLVLTVHSLEPLRPWKREQLGQGYDFTCWVERTAIEMADAVIAVSGDTKVDILRLFDVDEKKVHVIHNGIDLNEYSLKDSTAAMRRFGIDLDRPFALFVGRITRQKGIIHLAQAIRHMHKDFQIVLCAGAPDTPEIAEEMQRAVGLAQEAHGSVIWVREMVPKTDLIELYSHASVFCCPSVYEPFGIINLEAMACHTPVVASAVGGIKEVVVHGETGFLVPLELQEGTFEPLDADAFERKFAGQVNAVMGDAGLRSRMGAAGRKRAEDFFSWEAIAAKTYQLYAGLVADHRAKA